MKSRTIRDGLQILLEASRGETVLQQAREESVVQPVLGFKEGWVDVA